MSDILLEINEDLRNQRIKQIWDQYGQWIIGLIACIVLATAVGAYWHAYVTRELGKQTATMLTILQNEAESDSLDTIQQLAALRDETRAPLNAVADLYHAQKLEQANDLKAAQDVYQDIINNKQAIDITRDLARVHFTRLGLVLNHDEAALLAVIEPVTKSRASFRGSALELKALLLLKQNKISEANLLLNNLSKDDNVPTSLRQRAQMLVVYDEATNE